ncbi:MAG: efflux RND transporter periplasmic adaptor subunit [Acidobacteria bacterium]|nr:efflux RND transporter periplasmic adaptor subunit [Acidobacteriota bacterium]
MIRIGRQVLVLAIIGAAAAAVAGCGSASESAASAAPAAGKPPVAVGVATVAATDLQDSVEVVGSLEPKFSAEVKSEVSGIVNAVYVTEWVPVRRGARLARLDTTETEAGIKALEAMEAQARVNEARARREHERALQLKQYGLITPQNLDDAKTAVDAAEAGTAAARAQVQAAQARLAKSFITAPIDGVIALRAVNVGDRVENMGGGGLPLFRIVDNRLLDLTVSVPSSRLAQVQVGQPLEFTTDALPGRTFTGKVMFINPTIDPASRSAKVVAEVRNTDGQLKGGAFVKGRILVANRSGVLQVPREALQNWNVEQATADVYVVRGDTADRRQVRIGGATATSVEILDGLQAGEQVVTRGSFALKPGDRIAPAKGQGA